MTAQRRKVCNASEKIEALCMNVMRVSITDSFNSMNKPNCIMEEKLVRQY